MSSYVCISYFVKVTMIIDLPCSTLNSSMHKIKVHTKADLTCANTSITRIPTQTSTFKAGICVSAHCMKITVVQSQGTLID